MFSQSILLLLQSRSMCCFPGLPGLMSIYLSLFISNPLARKALLHLKDSTKEKNECFRVNLFHARNNCQRFATTWVER